jgi:tetratricopeptide (TPR) repeat protein
LEALYAILSVDRYTTLEELLELSLPDEVVQKLVGEAFNRLDPSAQKVMQALAVYNRPVSPAAIDYLLQPHLPSIDSALVLNRLVNMHFARREAGRYYLHPADKEYAFSIIPSSLTPAPSPAGGGESNEVRRGEGFTQHDLLNRAADFFAQARKPRAEWKKLGDLSAQLAEFELRCEAGDYDTAASVLDEIDFDYLLLWGHYHLMIDLHLRVKNKLHDKNLIISNMNGLGMAYGDIGRTKEAITYYTLGIQTAQEINSRGWESAIFVNLGSSYADLGDVEKSIEFYEKALTLDREMGDLKGEGNTLYGLGNRYGELGESHRAIEFYEQALIILRKIGDHKGEGMDLSNLAGQYLNLGEYDKSIDYYQQALQNAREIGNRYGEGKRLNGLAEAFIEKGDFQSAIIHSQEAIRIGEEINSPEVCIESSHTFAIGFMFSENLKDALQIVQDAEKYDRPNYNFNMSALHGIIALRQGERETAQEAFAKSIAQADEILAKTPEYYSALDAKGLSICGLTICGEDGGRKTVDGGRETTVNGQSSTVYRQQAIETFQKARKIAPHAGVVKSVLRLFDELVKCDEEGVLNGVRDAVEGESM